MDRQRDNGGYKQNIWKGIYGYMANLNKILQMKKQTLRKFMALVNKKGLDDGGVASFTFPVDQLIKGKIYIQADQSNYDEAGRNSEPFFVDDNGCSRNIKREIKLGTIKEIKS